MVEKHSQGIFPHAQWSPDVALGSSATLTAQFAGRGLRL
jgi:hypothetical protein